LLADKDNNEGEEIGDTTTADDEGGIVTLEAGRVRTRIYNNQYTARESYTIVNGRYKCDKCNVTLSTTGGTGNIRKHMERVHRDKIINAKPVKHYKLMEKGTVRRNCAGKRTYRSNCSCGAPIKGKHGEYVGALAAIKTHIKDDHSMEEDIYLITARAVMSLVERRSGTFKWITICCLTSGDRAL